MREEPVAPIGRASFGPLNELAAGVAFLTRLPVAGRADLRDRTGAASFGLVGAAVGAIAAVPLLLIGGAHPALAALAAIAVLAVIDGGLHLDGVADTFDALAAPPETAERARSDPRAGAAGVIAIVIVIGIAVASLSELVEWWSTLAAATLVAAASVSRAAAPVWAVLVGRAMPSKRGLGGWFTDSATRSAAIVSASSAAVVTAIATEFAGPVVLFGALAGLIAGSAAVAAVIASRRQLDGDGYGAAIELTFAAILATTALLR
jgi:adenosylcobinamide-GDP ribazoletransferase